MKKSEFARISFIRAMVGLSSAVLLFSCHKIGEYFLAHGNPKKDLVNLRQFNLVANNASYNVTRIDSTLLNAWGISFSTYEKDGLFGYLLK